MKPEAILASNTSSISITRLASVTANPERFIGMHFMNPVPRMQLVELIRGIATKDDTFEAAKAFVGRLGKTATMSEDFPAFIVNRILMPMINEAIYTLYEGVGSVDAIDTAMRLGANHPMGPLQLADFIGLDTCLSIMQVLHDGLADSKYRPCPLLVKYVEAGWLGRKTPARLLRLPRRTAGADAVGRPSSPPAGNLPLRRGRQGFVPSPRLRGEGQDEGPGEFAAANPHAPHPNPLPLRVERGRSAAPSCKLPAMSLSSEEVERYAPDRAARRRRSRAEQAARCQMRF